MGREAGSNAVTTTTADPNKSMQGGIRCPHCNCPHHSVTHTYQSEVRFDGRRHEYIRRRRKCRYCGLSFFSREVVEPDLPNEIEADDMPQVKKELKKTYENIVPERNLPDLPNPFL